MTQFLFQERESFFHRLHPSVKIVGLGLAFVPYLAFNDPSYIAILGAFSLLVSWQSGALKLLLRLRWLFLAIIFASFFLWTIFTKGGEEIFHLGSLKITKQGLLYAGGMALRLGLMLYLGLIFIASTRIEEVYYGLVKLGIPFPASFALSLSFRLVPIFSQATQTIIQAQLCRGLKMEGGMIKRFKSYLPVFIPVLFSALRKVDQLSIALETKGFSAKRKRTNWIEYKLSSKDYAFLFLLILLSAGAIWLRTLGMGTVRF